MRPGRFGRGVGMLSRYPHRVQPIEEPTLTPELIRSRADALMERLRGAAEAGGHDPARLRLVAVTKGFGVPAVRTAVAAGLAMLGENRVQEAKAKIEAHPEVEWHLVGRLQSNKARRAATLFAAIHSVDSLELLDRLNRLAHDDGATPALLLQVNLTGEGHKGGFDGAWFSEQLRAPGELAAALERARAARITGLMTMGRAGATPAEQRATFAGLRDLRDRLQQLAGRPLPELSMGMTADAEAAAAEGATLVRIGTAIFGPRPHD
jgi:pyridoxal phosphate enzyme (YggS family)